MARPMKHGQCMCVYDCKSDRHSDGNTSHASTSGSFCNSGLGLKKAMSMERRQPDICNGVELYVAMHIA